MQEREHGPNLSGWAITAVLVIVVACLAMAGCATPDAILANADAQVEAWRKVHDEGHDWTDKQWRLKLAGWAAEARTVRAWLRGELDVGEATRFKREEQARNAGP